MEEEGFMRINLTSPRSTVDEAVKRNTSAIAERSQVPPGLG